MICTDLDRTSPNFQIPRFNVQDSRHANKSRFEPNGRDKSKSPSVRSSGHARGSSSSSRDRMQLNPRHRNQSFRDNHGQDKKKFSDWQNWDELIVELGSIPPKSGAREIFRAFKEYGCIVYIRMDEATHTGQIRFR